MDKVDALCSIGRKWGVTSINADGIGILFSDLWSAAPKKTAVDADEQKTSVVWSGPAIPKLSSTPLDDSDRCACGHSMSISHTEAGCIEGCDHTLCAISVKKGE